MNCNKIIYTPGPTNLSENTRMARALKTTNPDVDLEFVEFYKETCDRFGEIINTKNDCYILCGEGILGLEAACASITEKGDRVLVLDNGLYGRWFDGFVTMYGGEVTYFSGDYTNEIDVEALSKFLKENNDFKYATIVHCDTPTGVLNPVDKICPLLKSYGILTVVDSVSGMVGEELRVDEWKIDIALGGSQKAFSAEPGLTMVSISDDAREAMENRETPVAGFYCNLNIWKNYYKDKWFPYTMPTSDIISLRVAIDNILDEGKEEIIERHRKIGEATRKALKEYGLNLFLENGYSNTVTAVEIPEEIDALKLRDYLNKEYNVLMSTSLDKYENKLLRIGHMGENARIESIAIVLNAIDNSLKNLGFYSDKSLVDLFMSNI
ncbi:alanine--glyoxylate aminotransferase family protein [Clostridium sp. LIBA-8841]|uniref:pyridoxal-phosphate-dependent aminotransferase family protein n=1 Tax=Clostridium sp. LIBA-8841 TaxID=2987530 RepID=UPI002AC3C4B8|nr:alanine--glyoxylate aminotransferase family protein [Clostridium sp. LIBA-8841]MDZ5253911.1 alanine--glyoxylate aminotransferase family protein [Clostridium sp. LIBA-8841]